MRVATRSRPLPTATAASASIRHATTPPASRAAVACRNAAIDSKALRVRKTPRRVRSVRAPATIWQNHNFVLLLGGQIVSLAGTGASQLALPLLVLWLTHSPVQAAVDGALYVLPYAVLCLPAGALVDRWDRKRVMIGCDIARAVLLLSIPLAAALGCLTIWLLYGLALFQGTLFCFFDLAATASLLRVASRKHLAAASSTYTAAVNGAQLFGPTLGGFLYSVGRTVPFLADAVSYAVSALSLLRIQVAFQEERTQEFDQPLRREISDGLTWLWRHTLLRSLALVSGSANLVLAAFPLVLILLAQRLHASAPLTGVVLTVRAQEEYLAHWSTSGSSRALVLAGCSWEDWVWRCSCGWPPPLPRRRCSWLRLRSVPWQVSKCPVLRNIPCAWP